MNNNQLTQSATSDVVSDTVHGNVDAVRKWLRGDGQFNIPKQTTVLSRAAIHGHTDICLLVIDCETVSTDDITTAFRAACSSGHLSVVQMLFNKISHLNVLQDCLHLAASQCHTAVVDFLLPQTHPTDADYMRWLLVQASARGDDLTHIAQLVNTIGPDVTDVMSHALWAACYRGRVDIVDWLMAHTSADVNNIRRLDISNGNMTSLNAACYEGHLTVAKRLLIDEISPCNVNLVNGIKCNAALHEVIWYTQATPLHVSCYSGETAAIADHVVFECDVNMQDRNGWTAMHYACMYDHPDIVKVLLSVFADTNITNDFGRTPVAVCRAFGTPELANYIQYNHLMYVSGDGDNNRSTTASGQVNQNNTASAPPKFKDSDVLRSVNNNNKPFSSEVENSVTVTFGKNTDETPTSETEYGVSGTSVSNNDKPFSSEVKNSIIVNSVYSNDKTPTSGFEYDAIETYGGFIVIFRNRSTGFEYSITVTSPNNNIVTLIGGTKYGIVLTSRGVIVTSRSRTNGVEYGVFVTPRNRSSGVKCKYGVTVTSGDNNNNNNKNNDETTTSEAECGIIKKSVNDLVASRNLSSGVESGDPVTPDNNNDETIIREVENDELNSKREHHSHLTCCNLM